MARRIDVPMVDTIARVVFTDRADGDYRIDGAPGGLEELRRDVVDAPWTWLRQVHSDVVVTARTPGDGAGATADAAVTTAIGAPLAVTTADCAPVVLIGDIGVGVAHAGWRGLLAGVVERTAAALGAAGVRPVRTLLGPCIDPEHYEFSPVDLDAVASALGDGVRAVTPVGTPALDVPAAVAAACRRAGWPQPDRPPATSDPTWFSHRVRGDTGRQTTVVWLEERGEAP
ncbi:MAG: laccase domain-containing protein [Acidimicrobiales bacterium]